MKMKIHSNENKFDGILAGYLHQDTWLYHSDFENVVKVIIQENSAAYILELKEFCAIFSNSSRNKRRQLWRQAVLDDAEWGSISDQMVSSILSYLKDELHKKK